MYRKIARCVLIGNTMLLVVFMVISFSFLVRYDHMIPMILKHVSEEGGRTEDYYSVYRLVSVKGQFGVILKCSDEILPEDVLLKYNDLILPLDRYGFVRKVGKPSFWIYELRIQRSEMTRLDNCEIVIGSFSKTFTFKTDIAYDSYYEIVVSTGGSGEIIANATESLYPNV